jgi:hypothetical protein
MARVRTHRRPKKKQKTAIVSPDVVEVVDEEDDHDDTSDHPDDNESQEEFIERLLFSTDDRRKVRAPIVVDNLVVETPVAEETALNLTLIPNNNLFCTSQLYAVAKPIILGLQEKVKGLIPIGDCWGMLRTSQLLEHIFNRTKYLFSILKTPSTETLR